MISMTTKQSFEPRFKFLESCLCRSLEKFRLWINNVEIKPTLFVHPAFFVNSQTFGASYNRVFSQKFLFGNLAWLICQVWGASYNRVRLLIKKIFLRSVPDFSRLRELPHWASSLHFVSRLPHSYHRRNKHGKYDTSSRLHDAQNLRSGSGNRLGEGGRESELYEGLSILTVTMP